MQIFKFLSLNFLLIKKNSFYSNYKISTIITIIFLSFFIFIITINKANLALGNTSEELQNSNIENFTQVNSLTPLSNIVYKPIKIDGREIFKAAAIAGQEIQGNSNTSPLNIRVRLYENLSLIHI